MEKCRVQTIKDQKVVKEEYFDDGDEAMAYYTELVMRQNYGEKQLQDLSFKVVLSKSESIENTEEHPEPDYF